MPAERSTDPDETVDDLYTRPLDEFVAARDAASRRAADAGDRLGAQRIKRLPKPSVAAWVVNHVAREHPEEVAALVSLGDELRAATADRDRGRVRALDQLRRERADALVRTVREAGEVGGRPVSAAVLDRLAETLTAAVMDPDAAEVVRAGRLSRALQHVGFGIVDEQGEEADLVVLRPGDGSAQDASEGPDEESGRESGRESGEESGEEPDEDGPGEDAADELAAAEREVQESAALLDRLEERRDTARDRQQDAESAVEDAQAEVDRIEEEIERLTAERDTARRAAEEARSAAEDARAELAAVDDELDDAEERAAEARRRRRRARGR
ncbi:hypothetical protein ACFQHV_12405 [Promicromonospora thailandica]|uniref:Uncharacterized protein n=1 Tax=Promicromonospora thailandica TaxID=765201 RepID=A0A9X2G5E9_9MICO|nr:hypothetical protein [Promicromonospora thailandica]MCP2265873.1 hypothetical protein [Promicromonospora thailandica]BFF21565.1 hypothetical protein GCM10025730_50860 [Promicromonospora thailandica]